MAHQNPREGDPQSEESNEQGYSSRQQQQESTSQDFPHQRLHSGAARSSPIAIRRNDTESSHQSDTSDDEGEGDDFVERDAIRLGNATSLPSRLLRAPFLGSVPTNEDNISYHNMLPPSSINTEQSDTTTSYGSLRDSHLRGRFLDGPSSYRDKRTGNVRRIQHRVRFRDNATTTDNTMMSIGERIQQSTRQQQKVQESKEPTSSLAAMLEGTEESTENNLEQQPSAAASIPFSNEDDTVSQLPANMLSTSLTGLEVLQRGLRLSEQQGDNVVDFEQDELPRDASGNNALLSRSFSDPTLQLRRLSVDQRISPQPFNHHSPSLLSPPTQPLPPALGNPAGAYHASFQQQQLDLSRQEIPSEEPSDHNPDTEGAFGMDDLEL